MPTAYNRKSIRLKDYDYSTPGYYFITIACNGRKELFGHIDGDEMALNDAGIMISNALKKIKEKYKNTDIPHSVVMPNHIHFIIRISEHESTALPEIIRWFKSITTVEYIKGVKDSRWPAFDRKFWQPRYYDHIIRTERCYNNIAQYIFLNPARWNKDKLNDMCDKDSDNINKMIKASEI